jgi:hypothetical protein
VAAAPPTSGDPLNTPVRTASRWSTASRGAVAATLPSELGALRDHLELCNASHGALYTARCAMQRVRDVLCDRVFTTLGAAMLLILVVSTLL